LTSAFLTLLCLSAAIILVGAELNAETAAQAARHRRVLVRWADLLLTGLRLLH
jgi:uncharacterized BrkB/YihY/UPF0761 family membrane protein